MGVVLGAVSLAHRFLVLVHIDVVGQYGVWVFTLDLLHIQFPSVFGHLHLPLAVIVEHIHQHRVGWQSGEILSAGILLHDGLPDAAGALVFPHLVGVDDAELFVACTFQCAQLPRDILLVDGKHLVASGCSIHTCGMPGISSRCP